ncbi:MAG: TonB-dependent receptor [Chitinophagales bacterium]|nr:TonB-dependent receptor [Chitinophagales bacterium]
MRTLFSIAFFQAFLVSAYAQSITGKVVEQLPAGKQTPIQGAVVAVIGTTIAATTDSTGTFVLHNVIAQTAVLVTISTGYRSDTTILNGQTSVTITLRPLQLTEVEVSARKTTKMDATPMNVEVITSLDLTKDACCNLSESFENSATVDISYSDAVSGAKEIRMLGLDGVYTQIMVENIPSIRSMGNTFGMNYIPGPMMTSIQVNKGAGSVVNGYESITGQINIELKKPDRSEKLFVNFFINQDIRSELNIISAHKIKKHWSSLTAVHGQLNWLKMDMNHDHYIDNPLVKNLNLFQRFTYMGDKGFGVWLAASTNLEERRGGSFHFKPSQSRWEQNAWGLNLKTQRAEVFAKTGWTFTDFSSVGIQYKYYYHHQHGYVGRRNYNAAEHFGYVNVIYQQEISEKEDLIKTGASVQVNTVEEHFDTFSRKRLEIVPGVFGETSLNFGTDSKVMLVGGMRVDYHNLYGAFASPRFNLKWNILYDFSLRVSAGRGYRVPTLFAENFGLLANSRAITINQSIQYEEAWNYGANLTYKFFLNFREGMISVDFYRTDFVHQVVVDLEDARQLRFYNLQGKSFANAFQADFTYEPVKRFDVKLAYKFEQNKTDYKDGRKIYPLRPQHRGLVSLSYTTKKEHWRFNTSLNWFGKTRIPDTSVNDEANRRTLQSKDWFQLNAQITFKWKRWEVYLGGENLLNFIQQNPIIAGDSPFSNQFDASLIWGPLRGAMAFTGVRFVLD